ncbi:hypothetical protein E4U58_004550 [Claviceps cyperi]|nr:hypothetical protein E4U58_004550 [Claviceps cyperi]
MAPLPKSERSLSDTVDAAERQKVLAANETSRAFIGGRRPSWMSSLPTPCTPTSPGPARVQKTRRGRAAIRDNRSAPALPTAVISPQSAAATGEMDLLPNLRFRDSANSQTGAFTKESSSEPPSGTLPPLQVPTTSEDHVFRSGAKIAAVGNGQRPVKPVDSSRTAIFLNEQRNASVADPANSTAEPFSEVNHEHQMRPLSHASSPNVTGGPSQDDPEHDANGPHPPGQVFDPSRVQATAPANQGSISPRSMNSRGCCADSNKKSYQKSSTSSKTGSKTGSKTDSKTDSKTNFNADFNDADSNADSDADSNANPGTDSDTASSTSSNTTFNTTSNTPSNTSPSPGSNT